MTKNYVESYEVILLQSNINSKMYKFESDFDYRCVWCTSPFGSSFGACTWTDNIKGRTTFPKLIFERMAFWN